LLYIATKVKINTTITQNNVSLDNYPFVYLFFWLFVFLRDFLVLFPETFQTFQEDI